MLQTTLDNSIIFSGIGLHSGRDVTLTLKPAPENHGILFKRKDIKIGNPLVRARWDYVSETTLCTKLKNEDGTAISTIEHLNTMHTSKLSSKNSKKGTHNLLIKNT